MTDRASSVGKVVEVLLGAIAIIASLMLVGLMAFLVVARYVIGFAIVGLHELILLFVLQLYMAGALIAAQRKNQISVDWLSQRLGGTGIGRLHDLIVAVLTLVATLFFIAWAYWMLAWGIERPQTTPALGLPLWISQVSIFVCALGCAGFAVRDVVLAISKLRGRI